MRERAREGWREGGKGEREWGEKRTEGEKREGKYKQRVFISMNDQNIFKHCVLPKAD